MANALGLPQDFAEDTSGKSRRSLQVAFPEVDPDWKPPADAVELALSSRPDIQAVKARARAGEARASLASLNRIPDPTFSVMTGRDTNDKLVGFGINIPLPLLNPHTGAYRAAVAERERARHQEQWSTVQLEREVPTALARYEVAVQALASFEKGRAAGAEENIKLAQIAFKAGELDLADLIIYLDRSLQARITRLELSNRMWLARIRVAEVLGNPEYILEGSKQ
jgi:outer membrane protein TolC